MGSLASRPSIPAAQPIYTPIYVPTPVAANPSTPDTSTTLTPTTPTPDEQASARRSSSLLDRNRGVLSTVLTGFRGILSQSNTPQRKTLLGE